MSEREPPSSLDDLDALLKKARNDAFQPPGGEQGLNPSGGMGAGFHVATELVVALLVAVAIGWYLDEWLETRPLFLIVFFFLGAAAGALNVYRRARTFVAGGESSEPKIPAEPSEDND